MEADSENKGKKVSFDEWANSSCELSENKDESLYFSKENLDRVFAAEKFSKREKKGHLLLQLQKTYMGDDRFKLDKEFEADEIDKLPSNLLGSLSTRERQDLLLSKKSKSQKKEVNGDQKNNEQMDELDNEEDLQWDTELGQHESEKSRAFNILSQFVPKVEIFCNNYMAGKSNIR